MDESDKYGAECSRKVGSGRRVTDAIRYLVNARSLQPEWAKALHKSCWCLFLYMALKQSMGGEGEV